MVIPQVLSQTTNSFSEESNYSEEKYLHQLCTSEEPVSYAFRWNLAMISCFFT